MKCAIGLIGVLLTAVSLSAADNALSQQEKQDGWILLFDGKSHDGWTRSDGKPGNRPVEEGCINPHKCGAYMMIHERQWENFVLSLDFKISKGCNSGVFFHTYPLTPLPGKDVGYNGLEVAIDDTKTADYHDTGAIYDLVAPKVNAMKPAGEWNSVKLVCKGPMIEVEMNGKPIVAMNLDEWKEPKGKFPTAYAKMPRKGAIGFQDHGNPVWFRNIRIRKI